jgi:hypothetical protein
MHRVAILAALIALTACRTTISVPPQPAALVVVVSNPNCALVCRTQIVGQSATGDGTPTLSSDQSADFTRAAPTDAP